MTELNDRIDLFRQTHGETCKASLPLLREMAKALSEAQAENEELSDRVEAALEVMYKDDSNYFATVIAAKYILENGLIELEALHDA